MFGIAVKAVQKVTSKPLNNLQLAAINIESMET